MSYIKFNVSDDGEMQAEPYQLLVRKDKILIIKVAECMDDNFHAVVIHMDDLGKIGFEYKNKNDCDKLYKLIIDALISDEKVAYVEFLLDSEKTGK